MVGCLMSERKLAFSVVGKITGGNRIKTTVRIGGANRTITTKSARHDLARVTQLAWVAAQECGWERPEASSVTIIAYNSRLDVDASCKVILDGMIGVAYEDDRTVVDLHVEKHRDLDGERYEVQVQPREPLTKPKPAARKKQPKAA